MTGLRRSSAAAVTLFFLAACGGTTEESAGTGAPPTDASIETEAPRETQPPPPVTDAPPQTEAPPETEAPTTTAVPTTTLAPTTTEPPPVIIIGEPDDEGVIAVAIDGERLDPLFDEFMDGADPLFLVHTQQADVFVGVELYTVFGSEWTGELGTFPADCTTHGICVYLDPDGAGPLVGGGPAEGEITVTQLDGGSIITLDEVIILAEDGQVYSMTGVTLTG